MCALDPLDPYTSSFWWFFLSPFDRLCVLMLSVIGFNDAIQSIQRPQKQSLSMQLGNEVERIENQPKKNYQQKQRKSYQ